MEDNIVTECYDILESRKLEHALALLESLNKKVSIFEEDKKK